MRNLIRFLFYTSVALRFMSGIDVIGQVTVDFQGEASCDNYFTVILNSAIATGDGDEYFSMVASDRQSVALLINQQYTLTLQKRDPSDTGIESGQVRFFGVPDCFEVLADGQVCNSFVTQAKGWGFNQPLPPPASVDWTIEIAYKDACAPQISFPLPRENETGPYLLQANGTATATPTLRTIQTIPTWRACTPFNATSWEIISPADKLGCRIDSTT